MEKDPQGSFFFPLCPQPNKRARMYGNARKHLRPKVILRTENTVVRSVCVHQRASLPDRMEREQMKKFESCSSYLMWFTVLLLSALAAGCGGGGGTQIFGTGGATNNTAPDTTRPRVTITVPTTTAPGPTPNAPTNTAITAIFTENMAPGTIS